MKAGGGWVECVQEKWDEEGWYTMRVDTQEDQYTMYTYMKLSRNQEYILKDCHPVEMYTI